MISKLIQEQLSKVEWADLSNFDSTTLTYHIAKRKTIKLEEDKCYLIHLKPTCFTNETVKINWNKGFMPTYEYLKVDISKIMGKMIKVNGVGIDFNTQTDLNYF